MKMRRGITGLAISAAAFVALLVSEGFSPTTYVPTDGDVPTIGFGITLNSDGSPIADGDTVDPVRALIAAHDHLALEEQRFRDSLPGVELHQEEYDVYIDFVYQFGIGNWRNSSMRRHLLAGEHKAACDALLMWRYQAGRDCALPVNWGPRGCKGVWSRQQDRHARCTAVQGPET